MMTTNFPFGSTTGAFELLANSWFCSGSAKIVSLEYSMISHEINCKNCFTRLRYVMSASTWLFDNWKSGRTGVKMDGCGILWMMGERGGDGNGNSRSISNEKSGASNWVDGDRGRGGKKWSGIPRSWQISQGDWFKLEVTTSELSTKS